MLPIEKKSWDEIEPRALELRNITRDNINVNWTVAFNQWSGHFYEVAKSAGLDNVACRAITNKWLSESIPPTDGPTVMDGGDMWRRSNYFTLTRSLKFPFPPVADLASRSRFRLLRLLRNQSTPFDATRWLKQHKMGHCCSADSENRFRVTPAGNGRDVMMDLCAYLETRFAKPSRFRVSLDLMLTPERGHAVGIIFPGVEWVRGPDRTVYMQRPGRSIRFFDPNLGEWRFETSSHLFAWLPHWFTHIYGESLADVYVSTYNKCWEKPGDCTCYVTHQSRTSRLLRIRT